MRLTLFWTDLHGAWALGAAPGGGGSDRITTSLNTARCNRSALTFDSVDVAGDFAVFLRREMLS